MRRVFVDRGEEWKEGMGNVASVNGITDEGRSMLAITTAKDVLGCDGGTIAMTWGTRRLLTHECYLRRDSAAVL